MVQTVCKEYHCKPSEAYEEDVSVLRMLSVLKLAYPPKGGDEWPT